MNALKVLVVILYSSSVFSLNEVQINRLDLLGKTWNAAKAFHSGACATNWDEALTSAIPTVIDAIDANSFNNSINTMLDFLGTNQISNTVIATTPDFLIQPQDSSWLNNNEFSEATKNRISVIIEEFRPRTNCFVSVYQGAGNGNFENDTQYYNLESLTPELKLLALFRFWGIYNYYSPYKNILDEEWQSIPKKHIESVYSAPNHLEYTRAMSLVIGDTQDTHGYLSNPEFNAYKFPEKSFPVILKTVEGKVRFFKNPNNIAEVVLGDEVISIDGRTIEELRTEYKKFFSYSNPEVMARKTDAIINRGRSENALLRVKNSENGIYEITLPYVEESLGYIDLITLPKWTSMDQETCTIGYVNMGKTEREDGHAIMADFEDKDAIIFDVRNYPGGTIATLFDYLFSEPINFASFAIPRIDSPGDWYYVESVSGQGSANPYSGRVIILMNERTQSHGEFTTMALENHPNAVKIGSQTAAADGNVSRIKLPGRIDTAITALGVYYPDGTATQRVGLVPDILVKPTITNVREGIDDLVQAATNCDDIQDLDWPQAPKPKSALFWDPNKSGTGRDLAEVGSRYTVIPYDYREDGSPVWYLGVAESNQGITTLLQNSMNEFSYNQNTGINASLVDFQMEFDFKSGPQETICSTYSQETKSYPSKLTWKFNQYTNNYCDEEFVFSQGQPEIDFTGLWWGGEAEAGWGISINTQGNTIVTILYYYDQEGRATWLLGSNVLNQTSVTQIELYKFNICLDCADSTIQSHLTGTITLSLQEATLEANVNNWVTLEVGDSTWNRNQMPIKMFSNPQN